MAVEARQSESRPEGTGYLHVLRNRTVLLLWSGQSISIIGDNFFNLAVMWLIYTQSHSALRTSLIQVVWHLDRIVFGPFAGIVADRWDRKRIMVMANVLSAVTVSALATVMLTRRQAPSATIFVAVFLLNSLKTFMGPAQASLMPEVVGRDLLACASGLAASVGNVASLVGSALAGIVVAVVGGAWAVVGDAVSFLGAALSIMVAAARADHPALLILP
jgi:MFS family permease